MSAMITVRRRWRPRLDLHMQLLLKSGRRPRDRRLRPLSPWLAHCNSCGFDMYGRSWADVARMVQLHCNVHRVQEVMRRFKEAFKPAGRQRDYILTASPMDKSGPVFRQVEHARRAQERRDR